MRSGGESDWTGRQDNMFRGELHLLAPYLDDAPALLAAEGLPRLEEYLARWAEVDRRHGGNG